MQRSTAHTVCALPFYSPCPKSRVGQLQWAAGFLVCVCVDGGLLLCRVWFVFFFPCDWQSFREQPISWFACWWVLGWKKPRGNTPNGVKKARERSIQARQQQRATTLICRQHRARTYSVHNKLGLSLWQAAFGNGEDQRHACVRGLHTL